MREAKLMSSVEANVGQMHEHNWCESTLNSALVWPACVPTKQQCHAFPVSHALCNMEG